jgi:hypothetical protein
VLEAPRGLSGVIEDVRIPGGLLVLDFCHLILFRISAKLHFVPILVFRILRCQEKAQIAEITA